jgi:neutral ceramidase
MIHALRIFGVPIALLVSAVVVFIGPWRLQWIEFLDGSEKTPFVRPDRALPNPVKRPIRVGAAEVSIVDAARRHRTPLAGYVGRVDQPNDGVKDDVAVQALVIDDGETRMAFVTADLLIISRTLAASVGTSVEKKCPKIKAADLCFGATHTHSGPGGFPGRFVERFGLGARQPAFEAELVEAMSSAVQQAEERLATVQWSSIAVEAPADCISNRTREGGRTNRWIDVMAFRKPGEDRWSASIAVFAAHATCEPSKADVGNLLSGDYPAALRRAVSRELGGVCCFFAGSVGSMAPGRITQNREAFATEMGERLAAEVVRAAPRAEWNSEAELSVAKFGVALPAPAVKLVGGWCLSPILGAALVPTSATISAARVGDVLFLGVPADFGGINALEVRERAPDVRTVVTSFSGDYVGYVIDDADYWLPKYEPRSMVFYGRGFGGWFNEALSSSVDSMSKRD